MPGRRAAGLYSRAPEIICESEYLTLRICGSLGSDMAPRSRLEFERPPIDEVYCGVIFSPLPAEFRIPHYGAFWAEVQHDYPKCEHVPPIGDLSQAFDQATGMPMPRVWLISSDDQRLIQLQRDRLLFNWRRRAPDNSYIRFPAVFGGFQKALEKFRSFAEKHGFGAPAIQAYDLTYTNLLLKGREWENTNELSLVLPALQSLLESPAFPQTRSINITITSDLPEVGGNLVVRIVTGERAIDKAPVIKFDIAAHAAGVADSIEKMSGWFDQAHDCINDAFIRLTSSDAQTKLWGRKDNARK